MTYKRGSIISTAVLIFVAVLTPTTYAGDNPEPDAVSAASASREPIWTARLFFIAVNDRDAATVYALFSDHATIRTDAETIPPARRDAWLRRTIIAPDVRLQNRGDTVVDRTITVDTDWSEGERSNRVVLTFTQSEDGLIDALVIEGDL